MNADEIAKTAFKAVFIIAVLIGGAYAVGNYPDLLVPMGAGWIVWGVCKLIWNEKARGITQDLLGLLGVAAVSCAVYAYATEQSEIAVFGAVGALGVGGLMVMSSGLAKWLAKRREKRALTRNLAS